MELNLKPVLTKSLLLFGIFLLTNSLKASCESGRMGVITRYGYPNDPNYDVGSAKHKGNRSNQLRGAGDGHQYVRKGNGAWSIQVHPGSCAVLGTKKKTVLGVSTNVKFDAKKSINPMLEIILSDGTSRTCCWEDSGGDNTADTKILKKPKTPQVVVDLFDPNNQFKALNSMAFCSVKVVGDCQQENYKGISPKKDAITNPVPTAFLDFLKNDIQGQLKLDPLLCLPLPESI